MGLSYYAGTERIKRAEQVFAWIVAGKINVPLPTVFPLAEGKMAHDFMETRKSTGKVLLVP